MKISKISLIQIAALSLSLLCAKAFADSNEAKKRFDCFSRANEVQGMVSEGPGLDGKYHPTIPPDIKHESGRIVNGLLAIYDKSPSAKDGTWHIYSQEGQELKVNFKENEKGYFVIDGSNIVLKRGRKVSTNQHYDTYGKEFEELNIVWEKKAFKEPVHSLAAAPGGSESIALLEKQVEKTLETFGKGSGIESLDPGLEFFGRSQALEKCFEAFPNLKAKAELLAMAAKYPKIDPNDLEALRAHLPHPGIISTASPFDVKVDAYGKTQYFFKGDDGNVHVINGKAD